MKITVANALLKELERIGVDTIFGIISIHNIPFYDAMERHGGFRVVSGRHEGAVVNMADAYSRVNGIGLVCVTYCVGGLNVLNAIAGAYAEKSPVVVISGAPGRKDRQDYRFPVELASSRSAHGPGNPEGLRRGRGSRTSSVELRRGSPLPSPPAPRRRSGPPASRLPPAGHPRRGA